MSALIIRATYRTRPKPFSRDDNNKSPGRPYRSRRQAAVWRRVYNINCECIHKSYIGFTFALHQDVVQPLEIPKLSLILHYLDDSAGRIFFCISLLVSYYLKFSEIYL